MNYELAELYGEPNAGKSWQDAMAGACYEDAGLMPHLEGVRHRPPVRHEAQGSTAKSMAGSGEARSGVEDRVST